MPELPEVETIVRDLNSQTKRKKITSVKILDAKAVKLPINKFYKQVVGQTVKAVKRRAKMVIIELLDKFLLIHLKMTGQLVYQAGKKIIAGGHPLAHIAKELPNKFTRVIFEFNNKSKLFFNDLRKFGWIKIASKQELEKIFDSLGAEPLDSEFNLAKLKEILSHKQNTTIKQAIMDQKYLVGLGNIYSDEALFLSGIKPTRKVKTLTVREIKKLWRAIPRILKYAIKHRGTSFSDYVDAKGEAGNFIKYLKVYGRAGEKCKVCGGVVKKTKINGRGTHWCDKCQK